jgi:hypothetical protein
MKVIRDKVLVRVVTRFSPIHGDPRGSYLQVAIPNMAGFKPMSSIPIPSIEKPYKLYRDSLVTSEEDIVRVLRWVAHRHDIEVYTKD